MPKHDVGTIIKPDGSEETIRPKNGRTLSLEELQTACGGYIQTVPLKPGNGRATLYCNEDGKCLGLKYNEKATALALIAPFPEDFIVGNAVLVRKETV